MIWFMVGPRLLFAGFLIWLGVITLRSSPLAGLAVTAVGGMTVVLIVRMLRHQTSSVDVPTFGDLNGPAFDSLVWAALGVPLLLGLILLILALTNGFGAMY
jgi:hypothetical protein